MASEYDANPKTTDTNTAPATNEGQAAQDPYTDSSGISINGADLNNAIVPYDNILLQYDNPTYHFTLYAYSANDLKRYESFMAATQFSKYILAESGTTGRYYIDDVMMSQLAPGSPETRNGSMLTIELTLKEMRGMYFLDELTGLSAKLGYKKYRDIPLMLELKHIGFNSTTGQPETIPGTTKTWRVRINQAPGKIDSSGTTYRLDLSTRAYGVDLKKWLLGEQAELTAGKTVGNTLDGLAEILNDIQDAQYGYLPELFPNELDRNNFWKIHVHPAIARLQILSDATQDTTTDQTKDGSIGSRTFKYKPSSTIGTIVDDILDCARTSQDGVARTVRQFVHVVPFQFYVGYDKFRSTDVYRTEIYVLPYTIADVQDIEDIRSLSNMDEVRKILENIIYPPTNDSDEPKKITMKRYDYQWSGLNTEILELELNANFQYTYWANRNIESIGQKANYSGIKVSETIFQNQIINNTNYGDIYATNASTMTPEKHSSAIAAKQKTENNTAYAAKNTSVNTNEDMQYNRADSISDQYLEDIIYNYDLQGDTIPGDNQDSIQLNIPIDYSNIPDISSNTKVSNASSAEIVKRSIRSNYYMNAFLQSLTMEVWGDPYWIGDSEAALLNKCRALTGQQYSSELLPSTHVMNNITAEPYLLLNITPPRDYSEQGILRQDPDILEAQTVYRLDRITSTFSGGKFTQKLEGGIVMRSVNSVMHESVISSSPSTSSTTPSNAPRINSAQPAGMTGPLTPTPTPQVK